ncbi:trypsin-like serine peptidase [Mammaliicoccus vitulinus]|uniref:Serine protease n=1 Tax=Mammaliicoccus vitulinus TaxID=71237 RepID=A0ABX7HHN6_9STAP|nr:serine protease [Mammaliicoccus vitulinus]MBO3078219.1 trypsin-like peptidase domain-containing protein [Mammaliicoccus vitulinus]PNZ35733.1 serine protease [Mammaliicoccus vitulinus]QRO85757.1 trypsin-like peptidase domain-containing protein [Mammaliicoccus vitulinus]
MLYLKLYLVLLISVFNYIFVPNDETATYKDTFTKATHSDYDDAFNLGSQIPNDSLTLKPYSTYSKNHIQGIGKVSSDETGKSGNGATGFVIDDHTIITASHVASDDDGNKETKQFYFYPSKSDQQIPMKFKVKKFYKSYERDVAVLITEQRLSKKVKPLQLASEQEIKNMKSKEPLYMLGYPNEHQYNGQLMYQSKGYFLKPTKDYIEYIGHLHRTVGFSGSPVFNKDNHVVGIHAHGIRPEIKMNHQSTRDIYTGGPLLTGKTRDFINQHRE